MNSGELTDTVSVLAPVSKRNAFGELDTVYETACTVRMKCSSSHGTVKTSSNAEVQDYTVTFKCYYYLSRLINENMRLRWKGHDYHINSIATNRRRNETTIECDRVNE